MIDEYQDTNNLQYKLIDLIARKFSNLCVVGDENQSIYGFRGANILNILNFEENYKDAKIIKLEENYRSTSTILEAANEVIKNNTSKKDKKLWTQNGKGEAIEVLECDTARDEVSKVIDIIREKYQNGVSYKDMTILYRTNFQSRVFEEGLLRYNIPYKVFGGVSFYSRAEIKDVLAYLSVLVNPKDELNLLRIINIPKRKLGERGIEKLQDYARDNSLSLFESLKFVEEITGLTTISKEKLLQLYSMINDLKEFLQTETTSYIVDTLLNKIGYYDYLEEEYDNHETRKENIEEFKNSILELEKVVDYLALNEFLENVSLVSATDNLDENSDFIKLMTIHNSKGLEFPIVFLVGFERGIFPSERSMVEPKELEEERRLCYVALTRAEKKLYLSHATTRFMYGIDKIMSPSLFLEEIPKDLLKIQEKKKNLYFSDEIEKREETHTFKKRIEIDTKNTIKLDTPAQKIISSMGIKVGDKVMHKKFGLGVVKSINDKKISVEFVDGIKEIAVIIANKFLTKV
jgi:ATP-dependent DNA helicase pcrA